MEIIRLPIGMKVFGREVITFPNGIGETFDELISKLPKNDPRPYYGISECKGDKVVYLAAALETFPGEGNQYGYETYEVEGGDYLATTIMDWRSKIDTIHSAIDQLLKDERTRKDKPCIEIYKDDKEMLCLVKLDEKNLTVVK